ncbi:MAG: SBBP repeat-containing protein [Verrucomicrobiota bacterium]
MRLRPIFCLVQPGGLLCGAFLSLTAVAALALRVTEPAVRKAQPLVFESNQGQYPATAKFVARGAAYYLTVAPTELRVTLQRSVPMTELPTAQLSDPTSAAREVRMEYRALGIELIGANPTAAMTGDGISATRVNYFLGNDPAGWRANVPAYQRLRIADVYPGINLLHYGNQQELEYDFEVAPGVDPGQIAMRFVGADQLRVDAASGDLILKLGEHELRQPKPVIYQTVHGQRRIIAGSYVLTMPTTVRFSVGDYDSRLPLVIDPVVSYSKLFGGPANDTFWATAVDSNGNVYLAGETLTPGFATLGAFQTNLAGTYQGHGDVVIAKLNNQLTQTNYITYLGGRYAEAAIGLAVDGAGNAYVTGYTDSPDFPTRFAVQANVAGPTSPFPVPNNDLFVAKVDASGSNLVFSTFYGGSGSEVGAGIALDAANNIYVVGQTTSTNFPVWNTANPALSGTADGFALKLDATGSNVVYAMYLGGSASEFARDIAVSPGGMPLVTGYTGSTNFPVSTNALQRYLNQSTNITSLDDSFFAELSPLEGVVNYATYLGGTNIDHALRMTVDSNGGVYLVGWTQSGDYPRTSTNFYSLVISNATYPDAFVTKLNPGYTNIGYSLSFGGNGRDSAWDVAVDAQGRASLIGETASTDFSTNALTGTLRGTNSGGIDAFIGQLNATGTAFTYYAYMGGLSEDIGYGAAVDSVGNVYFVGRTTSSNFPLQPSVTVSFADQTGFIVKMLADELPVLGLSLSGTNAVLSWSATAPEHTVQSSTNFTIPSAWVDLNVTPIVTNAFVTVTVSPTNPAQFFRLKP